MWSEPIKVPDVDCKESLQYNVMERNVSETSRFWTTKGIYEWKKVEKRNRVVQGM